MVTFTEEVQRQTHSDNPKRPSRMRSVDQRRSLVTQRVRAREFAMPVLFNQYSNLKKKGWLLERIAEGFQCSPEEANRYMQGLVNPSNESVWINFMYYVENWNITRQQEIEDAAKRNGLRYEQEDRMAGIIRQLNAHGATPLLSHTSP